ncbi:hypothetical protein ACFFWD_31825 [Bradyrhizobium erythrophlei]|uniref:hypothetical protein n=1 Tax=Bradyrhizobium erythrophlei TaxID=1437360 RepID=UPI0035EE1DB9
MSEDFVFQDKKGRTITFDVDDSGVLAYHQKKKIGEFTLRVIDDDLLGAAVHADVIDLDNKFHNAGIGNEMVRLAFQHHGQKIVPPATFYPESANRNTMTPEGFRLRAAGQKHGWVTEFPDKEVPDKEYDED